METIKTHSESREGECQCRFRVGKIVLFFLAFLAGGLTSFQIASRLADQSIAQLPKISVDQARAKIAAADRAELVDCFEERVAVLRVNGEAFWVTLAGTQAEALTNGTRCALTRSRDWWFTNDWTGKLISAAIGAIYYFLGWGIVALIRRLFRGKLCRDRTFENSTPDHSVVIGMTRAGKSATMISGPGAPPSAT